MDDHSLKSMLAEDRLEWAALCAALDAHPEGALHDPESPEWAARDVYAHLARWITHSTDHLEAVLAGRAVAVLEGSDDEINARWQAEDVHLSLDEARALANEAFERRVRAIESLTADRWTDVQEAIAHADDARHYPAHRSWIVS